MIYDLIHEVEKLGHVGIEVPEEILLSFSFSFEGTVGTFASQWGKSKLKRYHKKQKLGNYVSNTFMFDAFDLKGYSVLAPYLDGEVLIGECGKEEIYFYRPQIYPWHELLDPDHSLFQRDSDKHVLTAKEIVFWKERNPEAWQNDYFELLQYAFKPESQSKYIFKLDLSELVNEFYQVYTFATDRLKNLVETHGLTGFIFQKMSKAIVLAPE